MLDPGEFLGNQELQRSGSIAHATGIVGGPVTITVTVSDGQLTADDTFEVTEINDAPTISDITDQTVHHDDTLGPLAFTVDDAETDPATLIVTATSNNQAISETKATAAWTPNESPAWRSTWTTGSTPIRGSIR